MSLKRTPLFETHQRLGARLVEFGGWEMPVQYTSIVDEHLAVRQSAGLFDISHMGEVIVHGPGAAGFLNETLTNDVRKLAPGAGQYTLMCNERGGVIDDLYIYCVGSGHYLLIVNASRIEADYAWLRARFDAVPRPDTRLQNAFESFGAVAVQGPQVARFMDACVSGGASEGTKVGRPTDLVKNQMGVFRLAGGSAVVTVARTGYTGEDGFEVVAPSGDIVWVWDRIMAAGAEFGLKPAGLGARDTLRTEMGYPLYGHELDEETTPIEAGLGFFVALDKGDFNGRSVLAAQKASGVARKCVAFKMTERSAPPRPQYPIWSSGPSGTRVGSVASGTQSPSLGVGIGMGYVPPGLALAGTTLEVEIRGRRSAAVVVPKPIFRRTSAKP